MEIQYLTKMKNNPKVGRWEIEGISEQEIIKIENEFKIKLPKAYKEFLYLGGKYTGFMQSWTTDAQYLDWSQTNIRESMDNINLHLRPFFAFADFEGINCLFFFLDEGENPPIYGYDESKIYTNEKGEEVFYKKTDNSFSDCIDGFIDYALQNG